VISHNLLPGAQSGKDGPEMNLIKTISTGFLLMLASLNSFASFTIDSAVLSGPSIICFHCPPGGEAEYTITLKGTSSQRNQGIIYYSVYDDDYTPDDVLVKETRISLFNLDLDAGGHWTESVTFKLFCNVQTNCDVAGVDGDSWEKDPVIFAKIESTTGSDYLNSNFLQVMCVPEPSTMAFALSGLAMLVPARRRAFAAKSS
jgi:hypothetical protein